MSLFNSKKAPTPVAAEPLPPAPNRSADDIQRDVAEQRKRYFGASGGRVKDMLTGGTGTNTPQSAVVRLLGEVGR